MVDPFSAANPSGKPMTVFAPKSTIVYAGAIVATIIFILVTLFSLLLGFYDWGPDHMSEWMDPGYHLVAVMVIFLLLLVPAIVGSPWEYFLASDAELVHIKRKEEASILWKEVTDISTIPHGRPLMVRFLSPTGHIDTHVLIEDVERLFEVALRRLPENVGNSEAYV